MYIENNCTGCSACANVCPVNAISMIMDKEGFLQPAIVSEKCINCESCIRVCPVLSGNMQNSNWKEPRCYAFSAEKKLTYKSSSGGLFSVLAEKTIKDGGIVFGAAFDDDFYVKHEEAVNIEDIDMLRLSKYVQSEVGDSISKTAKHLKNGKKVLYTGTPCQIAGLKSYLREAKIDDTDLVTLDLICHGVPSPGIFNNYLEQEFGIDNIDRVYMRRRAEWSTCLDVYLKSGKSNERKSKRSVFQLAFLEDLILRKSCYDCKYASLPRVADITIGDFWGVKKFKLGKEFEHKCSISVANNEKGRAFLEDAVEETNYNYSFLDLTAKGIKIAQLNKNIRKPLASDRGKRKQFYQLYDGSNFKDVVYKVVYPNCVGLVLKMTDNYGSCATNTALYKAIELLGYTPLILNHLVPIKGVSSSYAKKYLRLSDKRFNSEDYEELNLFCDSFILGSDLSLRWDVESVYDNFEWLFLAFAEDEKRKIAYAGSYGPDRKLDDPIIKNMYMKCFERFTDFSVREDYAVEMLKSEFNRTADWVVDPVFLITKKDYEKIIAESKTAVGEPYLLAYFEYYSERRIQLIKWQAEYHKLKAIVICDKGERAGLKEKFDLNEIIEKPEFIDWLAYYANADYIITDSFHGTCFSIIMQKKYISIQAKAKQRLTSLTNMFGLEDTREISIYENEDELLLVGDAIKEVNYDLVNEHIKKERERCLKWLHNALTREVTSTGQGVNRFFIEYVKAVKAYAKRSIEFENYKKNG